MFEGNKLDELLSVVDTLLWDPDKYKQRAAAEFLAGLLRGKSGSLSCTLNLILFAGSKHWPKYLSEKLWSWTMSRLDRIFAQIKPDTLALWESVYSVSVDS